jgi:hypothetical protein
VDRAPLPPHERPWRHPSELGPPAHEPTSTSGRVIIATAATLSLLLIGLLAISMTPDKGGAPQTLSSTSGSRADQSRVPLVTPIGDDGWAITTTGAIRAHSGVMSARLPSGDVVDVEIVDRNVDDGLTLVSLPTQTRGYHLARSRPAPTDMVVVHGTKTQFVEMVKVSTLDVEEGAAVVDDDGDLVGVCATTAGTVEVRSVSTLPGAATTTTSSTTTTTTTMPATTAPTTATPTTAPAPTTNPVTIPPSTSPATSASSSSVQSTTTTVAPPTSGLTSADAAASDAPG